MANTSQPLTSGSYYDYELYGDYNGTDMEMLAMNMTGFNITEYLLKFMNDSSAPTLIQIITVSENTTLAGGEVVKCDDWQPAQSKMFQIASFLLLCSYLIPKTIKNNWLISRGFTTASMIMFVIWSFWYNCSTDLIAWNITQTVVLLITWIKYVVRMISTMNVDVKMLFTHKFKDLHIDRRQFESFAKLGKETFVNQGFLYAVERETPITHAFSALLRGKMRVSMLNMDLYSINALSFIDAIDWELNDKIHNSFGLYQVTIVAEEPCHIVTWNMSDLRIFLKQHARLRDLLHYIVGLDVSHKMNDIDGMYNPSEFERRGIIPHGIEAYRRLVHSLSADAVDTSLGTVRSKAWRAEERRRKERTDYLKQLSKTSLNLYLENDSAEKNVTDTMIANQFPAQSPFSTPSCSNTQPDSHLPRLPETFDITEETEENLLLPRPKSIRKKKSSVRRHGTKEVKFESQDQASNTYECGNIDGPKGDHHNSKISKNL